MKKLILVLLPILFSACTVTHGTFTVMSNKIVDVNNFELSKRTKNVQGDDTQHIFIFVQTGIPSITNALNNALEKSNADVMTDVTVKSWGWYIPYIYGQFGWEVSGDAVKTRNN